MPEHSEQDAKTRLKETADNAGARVAATSANPKIGLEEARNATEGKGPNAMGGGAPNPNEDKVASTSSPEGSALPNPELPLPDDVGSDYPANAS